MLMFSFHKRIYNQVVVDTTATASHLELRFEDIQSGTIRCKIESNSGDRLLFTATSGKE